MPRPRRMRNVCKEFEFTFFKPNGIPKKDLEDVELLSDELEAMRLLFLEGLYQDAASEVMGVSRQTLGNILKEAQRKITDALVNGKAISIGAGDVSYQECNVGSHCCGSGKGRRNRKLNN